MRTIKLLFFLVILGFGNQSYSQILTPTTIMIPTSQGDSLEADLYLPNLVDTFPVVLLQTPYNKLLYRLGLPLGVGTNLSNSNYAFVISDWRGRFANLSKANSSVTNGEDGYDIVEWIAAQTWSNGKIGTWGPSALGNVQFETAKEKPPHLTCCVPMVASPHFFYKDYFSGGALKYEFVDQLNGLGYGIGPIVLANPFKNLIWNYSESTTVYPSDIEVPMLMIGGWFDHNTDGTIFQFDTCTSLSPLPTGQKHHMLMGPWAHGGNGSSIVGSGNQGELNFPEAAGTSDSMANAFFDYYLRGINNGWNNQQPVMYFQMGDNQWLMDNQFPPSYTTNQTWYLQADNSISTATPTSNTFSYQYDPLDPSPTIGGATLRNDLLQGPYDQKDSVESRLDNTIFSTDTLTSDLKIKGKIIVTLYVSSDKKDTDFGVRLTDVYPDGKSILLNEGNIRMRFRNGYTTSDTASMIPGTVYPVEIELPYIAQTFKAGHQLRIIVTSSNYPKRNRNMNNGEADMYPGDNMDSVFNPLIANNTVYVGGSYNSHLVLPVDLTSTSINKLDQPIKLTVSPNPTTNFISVKSSSQINKIDIVDLNGNLVLSSKSNRVNLEKLASGKYILNCYTENGLATEKIIKQ